MKTTELVATKCNDCPFSYTEHGIDDNDPTVYSCLAPSQIHESYNIEDYYNANMSPYWCPLKKTDLLITFKK